MYIYILFLNKMWNLKTEIYIYVYTHFFRFNNLSLYFGFKEKQEQNIYECLERALDKKYLFCMSMR